MVSWRLPDLLAAGIGLAVGVVAGVAIFEHAAPTHGASAGHRTAISTETIASRKGTTPASRALESERTRAPARPLPPAGRIPERRAFRAYSRPPIIDDPPAACDPDKRWIELAARGTGPARGRQEDGLMPRGLVYRCP